jgi:hypothetical protein
LGHAIHRPGGGLHQLAQSRHAAREDRATVVEGDDHVGLPTGREAERDALRQLAEGVLGEALGRVEDVDPMAGLDAELARERRARIAGHARRR